MNVIQHNMNAMFSERQLSITTGIQAKSSEKLSSGYRINRAADDAAGLSMSEKMRRQIRGLTQASKNAQDGVSLLQIADGAMNEDHDMLQRMNELAVKAANGTLQSVDRAYIDDEVQKLKEEITAVARKTTFNEIEIFPPTGSSPKELSPNPNVLATQDFNISIGANGEFTVTASDPMTATDDIVNKVAAASGWQELAKHIADDLIPNAVGQILDKFNAFQQGDNGNNINVALRVEYIDGPSNTLAYAQFGYQTNGTT
ncbi:MAG: flagellin, partial [Lachnospiraceae bacterium]|nr:flagellin [Lachnospiraceae bacterium]